MKAASWLWLAASLAWVPGTAPAVGSLQPKPNKDFRELIVQGERPEIAACLASALARARQDQAFSAIRWGDAASDRAVLREVERDGQRTRYIHLVTLMRVRGSPIALETWRRVEVRCEQPEDGAVHVELKALGR